MPRMDSGFRRNDGKGCACALGALVARGRGTPSPPPSPARGEGAGTPSRLCPACRSGRGRGGAAPTDKKSEGGWVGQSGAQRVLLRDGGVGGAAPRRRTRARPRRLVGRRAPEPLTPALSREGRGGRSGLRGLARGGCRSPAAGAHWWWTCGESNPRRRMTSPRRRTSGRPTPEAPRQPPGRFTVANGLSARKPSPPPSLPQGARGPERPRDCAPPADPDGGVGAKPPHGKKSEGGWVGRSGAQRTLPPGGGRNEGRAFTRPPLRVSSLLELQRQGCHPGRLSARRHAPVKWIRRPSTCPCKAPLTPALSRKGRGGRNALDGCGDAADPDGGVGAKPPQTRNPRAGGWARAARSACSSGMGVWGAQPPQGTRACPRRLVGRRAPEPLRCPGWIPAFAGMTERGALRLPIPTGAWGRSPHMERNPRAGGWATSRAARSSGMGAWGAQPPAGRRARALEGLLAGGRGTPSDAPDGFRLSPE